MDGETGVVAVAALRAAAEPKASSANWAEQFDGMVASATEKGWSADDGAGLQVHVEPAASA